MSTTRPLLVYPQFFFCGNTIFSFLICKHGESDPQRPYSRFANMERVGEFFSEKKEDGVGERSTACSFALRSLTVASTKCTTSTSIVHYLSLNQHLVAMMAKQPTTLPSSTHPDSRDALGYVWLGLADKVFSYCSASLLSPLFLRNFQKRKKPDSFLTSWL